MATRMEKHARMEKYRKRKIKQFINFLKINIILLIFLLMGYSLFKVNDVIIELNCLDNPQLIGIDGYNNTITILGKPYNINLEVIKRFY